MKRFGTIIKNDFKNFMQYNILQTIVIISILFALSMVFVTSIEPLIFIYVTVFILPVILLSVSIYIENEEKTLFPLAMCDCSSIEIILAKMTSAMLMMFIPFILYIIIMYAVLGMTFNFILFFLVYLLASAIHIVIGIVLAIISKSSQIMGVSYVAYIVIFSVMPIFYSEGLIPSFFQYVLIVSPAYLSGLLFQEVMFVFSNVSTILVILAIVLQIAYIGLLTYFVIRPYFKSYLFFRVSEKGDLQA